MDIEIIETAAPYLRSDAHFDELYPHAIQSMSKRHWTPLHIVKLATEFLSDAAPHSKVLDIGSGSGKFCLAAALYAPEVQFVGIEQRGYLTRKAQRVKERLNIENASFIEGNFTQLNLSQFSRFYFFNSFYENLEGVDKIDNSISYSEALYDYYVRYLRNGFKALPAGTKIVTYHSLGQEIPRTYNLVDSLENGDLNFWVKQ